VTHVPICFKYRQNATIVVESRCLVPAAIASKGLAAVELYLHEHSCDWEDGDYDITEFKDQLSGPINITIGGKAIA
jgi:hypothetical protein